MKGPIGGDVSPHQIELVPSVGWCQLRREAVEDVATLWNWRGLAIMKKILRGIPPFLEKCVQGGAHWCAPLRADETKPPEKHWAER